MGLKAACERSPHKWSWVFTITSWPLVILFVYGLIMMPVEKKLESWCYFFWLFSRQHYAIVSS